MNNFEQIFHAGLFMINGTITLFFYLKKLLKVWRLAISIMYMDLYVFVFENSSAFDIELFWETEWYFDELNWWMDEGALISKFLFFCFELQIIIVISPSFLNVTRFFIFSLIDYAFIFNVSSKKQIQSDDTISIHYSPFISPSLHSFLQSKYQ